MNKLILVFLFFLHVCARYLSSLDKFIYLKKNSLACVTKVSSKVTVYQALRLLSLIYRLIWPNRPIHGFVLEVCWIKKKQWKKYHINIRIYPSKELMACKFRVTWAATTMGVDTMVSWTYRSNCKSSVSYKPLIMINACNINFTTNTNDKN